MAKAPSESTQLRTARREVLCLQRDFLVVTKERDHYRARATKAEQECAEWKRRFDALLARDIAAAKRGEG